MLPLQLRRPPRQTREPAPTSSSSCADQLSPPQITNFFSFHSPHSLFPLSILTHHVQSCAESHGRRRLAFRQSTSLSRLTVQLSKTDWSLLRVSGHQLGFETLSFRPEAQPLDP